MNTIGNRALDDLDLLVRTARGSGMKPAKFVAGIRDAMHRISELTDGHYARTRVKEQQQPRRNRARTEVF